MEYTSLKVPELRKLLGERSLPVTGNKADLVARLQEDDKKKVASEAQPGKNLHLPTPLLVGPSILFLKSTNNACAAFISCSTVYKRLSLAPASQFQHQYLERAMMGVGQLRWLYMAFVLLAIDLTGHNII